MTWGGADQLVTSSELLKLWEVNFDERKVEVLWAKRLASPAISVTFSPDNYLLATMGENDRLVKIWRRSSFDSNYVEFDFIYLSHPQKVTEMRWRQPLDFSQTIENTLYTYCSDGIVRIWSPLDVLDLGNLQLWANIDTNGCARTTDGMNPLAFIIDNKDVSRAIEGAVIKRSVNNSIAAATTTMDSPPKTGPEVEKLLQLGQSFPEIMIMIYLDGTYSAYIIENIGLRREKLSRVRKYFERKPLTLSENGKLILGSQMYLKLEAYLSPDRLPQDRNICILIHDHDGMIVNYTTDIVDLLHISKPTKFPRRTLHVKSIFTGHSKSVQSIVRSTDGNCLMSRSRFSETVLWKPERTEKGTTLKRTSLVNTRGAAVRSMVIINEKTVVIFTVNRNLVLWDCTSLKAVESSSVPVLGRADLSGMFLLPESDRSEQHLILVFEDKQVQLFLVSLNSLSLQFLSSSKYPCDDDDIYSVVAVDPVGWRAKLGSHVDVFQREVLSTLSETGVARVWTLSVVKNSNELLWLQTAKVQTGEIKARKAQVSSTKKLVIASQDGNRLSIWDLKNNLKEFMEELDNDSKNSISDLDWTTTPGDQCVLGVGFSQQVTLYSQQRFDYTNKTPSWVPFRKVDFSVYTPHSIGDSIWLKNGTFVIGIGNQLFIQDEKANINDETTRHLLGSRNTIHFVQNRASIFDICSLLNGPLPMYHPQLLIQTIFADKIEIVKQILVRLLKELRYTTILEPSMIADVPSMLGINPEFFTETCVQLDEEVFDSDISEELLERLQRVSLPYLTRHQQITLVSVIEAMIQMEQSIRSLDSNAIKYLLGYKLYTIHRGTQNSMTLRDFNWALHSESQTVLMDLVEANSTTTLWPRLRDIGIPFWAKNQQLIDLFETLGRNYFNHEGERNPVKCSLYYLALKKKQVLVGLWKTASWNREQDKTIRLLSNDFTTDRWKSAASKNAFALLGKHRYEYAAAFFLLGDSLRDAVNVIIKNMNDIALAIAVARVYEGDNGPVLKKLIEIHILPTAEKTGDHWLFSWALWFSGRRGDAIEGLMGVGVKTNELSYLVDDPVLVILYRYLRDKRRKSHRLDRLKITAKDELKFVNKMTSIYSRMGCDVLALDLLQGWSFMEGEEDKVEEEMENDSENKVLQPLKSGKVDDDATISPPRLKKSPLLNRRQSIFAVDVEPPPPMKELVAAPSVAFQEPDMSAFDFGM